MAVLCLTEITSWGVLYYAFPVLAPSISRTTGWSLTAVTGAFSAALLAAALLGILVGRAVDRYGPRLIMTSGSLLAPVAVAAIALAPSYPLFLGAWVVAGAAISTQLYPPAFTALTHWGGAGRVRALTVLTLVGGLASTVFAPLTAVLQDWLGWREALLTLAVLHAVITVPAHWLGLRLPWVPVHRSPPTDPNGRPGSAVWRTRPFLVLVTAMSAVAVCVYAVVINLVPLLMERGLTTHEAAIGLGLGGVGQVVGRLGYAWFTRRTTPTQRVATVFGVVAATTALLALLPGPMLVLFLVSVLVGAGRGVFTLLQATVVSDRWGTAGFGHLNGIMLAPVMVATAAAPWLGSLLAQETGSQSSAFLVLAGLAALAVLLTPWGAPRPPVATAATGRRSRDSQT